MRFTSFMKKLNEFFKNNSMPDAPVCCHLFVVGDWVPR